MSYKKFRARYRFVQLYANGEDWSAPPGWVFQEFLPGEYGPIAVIFRMEAVTND